MEETPKDIVSIALLEGCARCGDTHKDMEFKPLTRPIIVVIFNMNAAMTHWATCPTNGEPIIMAITRKMK